MGRRSGSAPSPPLAVLLLLLLLVSFLCGAAAARALPPVNHENGVSVKKDAADGLALREGAACNGDELLVSGNSEVKAGEEAEEATTACGEGDAADECAQRRLLSDAHLDYIYTQHKGKAP